MQSATFEPAKLSFRDAVAADIPFCLALDSDFQTEHVWQMTVQELANDIQINCRRQRLPRRMEGSHATDGAELEMALHRDRCFVVIQHEDSRHILGFITMRVDIKSEVAYLQDIVVDRPYRRRGLGARLAHVGRVWASEYRLRQIIFEIPTTNYPCIQFAQALGFAFCGFNDHHFVNREIALFFSSSV